MRLFIISWAFEPMNLPRSHQVTRLVKALDFDEVHVVCATTLADKPSVEALKNGVNIYRLPNVEFSRLRRRAGRLIPLLSRCPDPNVPWSESARKFIANTFKPSSEDCLITFGNPMSDHLAGLRLKTEYTLTWLAHFSDPWPYTMNASRLRFITRANRRTFRTVCNNADLLIFTNATSARLCTENLPSSTRIKARVLNHSFPTSAELSLAPTLKNDLSGPPTLRYMGSLYGRRNAVTLSKALRKIQQSGQVLEMPFRVQLIGPKSKLVRLRLKLICRRLRNIELLPEVSYEKSFSLMQTADALISIDAASQENPFVSSKLVEYLPFAKPILGISPPGASQALLDRLGAYTADPTDQPGIESQLLALVSEIYTRAGTSDRSLPYEQISEFEVANVVGVLMDLIQQVRSSEIKLSNQQDFDGEGQ